MLKHDFLGIIRDKHRNILDTFQLSDEKLAKAKLTRLVGEYRGNAYGELRDAQNELICQCKFSATC